MTEQVRVVGRYALYNAIAAGGMATVHLGRLLGPVGFSRTVAIKRLHAQFASDPEFVSMFLDEARLAARIRHPNVVPTLDVVATGGELFLVMEYVPGESLARLSRVLRERNHPFPLRILSTTIAGVLHGLHAAHEAKDERGHPLGIVHRDVSPQNVLLGTDGVPRVLDFGVAKAAGRMQTTKEGQIKGKLSYMPPEQLRGASVSRQSDIYAVGVMLWELITGQRLFAGDNEGVIVAKILEGRVERPSTVLMRRRSQTLTDQVMRSLESLDETVLRALQMDPDQRFTTAREMALAVERRAPPGTASECGDWVESVARDVLLSRAAMIAEIESSASMSVDSSREGHVASVMNAKATLGPGASIPYPRSSSIPLDPPVTQPSSISVSSSRAPAAPASGSSGVRNGAIMAALFVLVGVVALGGAVVYRASLRKPAQAMVQPPGSAMQASTALAPPANGGPLAGGQGEAPLTPLPPPPDNDGDAADAGLAHSAPIASASGKPRKPAAPRPSAAPVEDCSTPYFFEGGVKKYKPPCLGK